MSILEKLLERLNDEDMQRVMFVARQIWHRRNTVVFGGKFSSAKLLLCTATDQVEAFKKAKEQVHNHRPSPRRSIVESWRKPPRGIIKVNWDASVDSKGKRIGIGLIMRDHGGAAIAMLCETTAYVQDPATAEAIAARRGVEFCAELGIRRVILERDALQIVQALNQAVGGLEPAGVILHDAQSICKYM